MQNYEKTESIFRPDFICRLFCFINAPFTNGANAKAGDLLSASAKANFEERDFAESIEEMSEMVIRAPENDAAIAERQK